MDLLELIKTLESLVEDHELWDEGCVVQVNGRDVIAAEWDGNTTIEIMLES